MNCVDWQERIALHAGGDAPVAEAEAVERHLSECPGCQVYWSEMQEGLATLREFHGELPAEAHFTAVRSRVIAELERTRHPWRRLAWISGLAAALVLMAVLWPRAATPVAPRMAAVIPSAPLVVAAADRKPRSTRQAAKARTEKREPIRVQMQTSDPNILIYWIAD